MEVQFLSTIGLLPEIIRSASQSPIFRPGDRIRISSRSPVGHYRMPFYLRGKRGLVVAVIESSVVDPAVVDNEVEGYGRDTRSKPHYYLVAIPMTEIWPDYIGSPRHGLRIEIFECCLARI